LVYRLKIKQDNNWSPFANLKEKRAYILYNLANLGVYPLARADNNTLILIRAKELTPIIRKIGFSLPILNKENLLSL